MSQKLKVNQERIHIYLNPREFFLFVLLCFCLVDFFFKEENLKAPLIPRSKILRISEALKFLNFAVCPLNITKVSELVLSQTSSHGFLNSQILWILEFSAIWNSPVCY